MPEKNYKLVLGSQSPRRKELLGHIGLPFEIRTADLDEISHCNHPVEVARDLALQKGRAVIAGIAENEFSAPALVISSDTIVCLGDAIYNKPADRDDARRMLSELSGKTHIVRTGVAFHAHGKEPHSFVVETAVTFDEISPDVMEVYLDSGDSLDKAGAYGIQGGSLTFISKVEGSYSCVVGFPLSDVVRELKAYVGGGDHWRERFV